VSRPTEESARELLWFLRWPYAAHWPTWLNASPGNEFPSGLMMAAGSASDCRCDVQQVRVAVCRNIKTLHNFKPPATTEEIRASSLQFVRKLSGFTQPSKTNQAAFDRAVDEVAKVVHELLDALVTNAPPRDRAVEAAKARARGVDRFGAPAAGPAT
jgi:hypothetical protein